MVPHEGMNPENRLAIAIDVGGTSIKGALVNEKGEIVQRRGVSTQAVEGFQRVSERIGALTKELREDTAAFGLPEPVGVGIGVPGSVEPDVPDVVTYAPNLKWWNAPLGQRVREFVQLPVVMENDANVAAIGEKWMGAGQGIESLAVVTIGTGIGCGLILDGRLYRGPKGAAGEIGHTILLPDGPLCNCGKRGCLEALTAAPAVVRMAREQISKTSQGILRALFPDRIEAHHVFEAGREGDSMALEIVHRVAYYLGWGLANLINTLNPQCIVLGGGVAQAGEILFAPVREKIYNMALTVPAQNCAIVPAQLGNDAGVVGAAALFFSKPEYHR